jgi:hypothetical protein
MRKRKPSNWPQDRRVNQVDAEMKRAPSEQDVVRKPVERAAAGIHEQHAAGNGKCAAVNRTALRVVLVDGIEILSGVEALENRSDFSRRPTLGPLPLVSRSVELRVSMIESQTERGLRERIGRSCKIPRRERVSRVPDTQKFAERERSCRPRWRQ